MDEEYLDKQLILTQIEKITQAIAMDDPITALSEADIIIRTLPDNYIKQYQLDVLKRTCRKFLQEPKYNRILRLNQRVKQEQDTAIEYYDRNIGQDQRLYYQPELEKDILDAYTQIRHLISTLIKTEIKDEMNL